MTSYITSFSYLGQPQKKSAKFDLKDVNGMLTEEEITTNSLKKYQPQDTKLKIPDKALENLAKMVNKSLQAKSQTCVLS